ncbi:MAG: cytochrome b/b6 domain-containing protein [Acidobacteriota bacterium]|nr:cytochrome b/b6 domain-containing protein [Acidobacteriota bacterium]
MRFAGKFCALSIFATLLYLAYPAAAQPKPKDAECLACHSDPAMTTEPDASGKRISLYVDPAKMKGSVMAALFSCVDCHKDVKSSPHEKTPAKIDCAGCHADAQSAYAHSYHATARKPDGSVPATCTSCHGDAHAILPAADPKSPVYHSNIPTTCGTCHGQKFLMESTGNSAQPFVSYQESVHGRAVEKGSQQAAVCTDCHGAHDILPANNASSRINKFNVPGTCGKCHAGVQTVFMQSIHGQAIARGNGLAPVCTDCHGIHTIKAPSDPNSSVSSAHLSSDTCARCHQGVRLTQEFGVVDNRISTYNDSYHGLASQGGSVVVANCSSCHGVHNIRPSSDPQSTINPASLDATCGQCHKGVTQKFTLAKVHVDTEGGQTSDSGTRAVRYVRWFYIPLILLVIGGMFLHNAVIWRAKMIARRNTQTRTVLRMTPNQRRQHLVLLTSFFALVVTGFALKYPDSWFAALLGLSEHWRRIIHRIAGVVLVADGIYHIFYVALTVEGRRLICDLFPTWKDVTDAVGTMLYYTGFRKQKPKFARFNYAEKAEYWALVWGTALMAVTGIMLWAKIAAGNLLARWWLDAATAVHFYEAILATLAILIWHFYQVFFDPDVYPMNSAWQDGRMPFQQYREEHELDTETLARADSGAVSPTKVATEKEEEHP